MSCRISIGALLLVAACHRQAGTEREVPHEPKSTVVPGAAAGPPPPAPQGRAAETAAPDVPEFKPAFAGQTRAPRVQTQGSILVTEVARGFDLPWAIAFLPTGPLLVTEKHEGKLYVAGANGEKSKATLGVPRVDGRDQGGLLDVEIGPTYAQDQLIYLSYYEPREGGNGLAVARARLVDATVTGQPRLERLEVVFRMLPTLNSTKHAGGRLVFAPDGLLFITLGERSIPAGRAQARDLASHFGKIARIRPDGTVPPDNPFVGRADARAEIWTLGHRNVLGAALDRQGQLWVAEMGPRGGDELNRVDKGKDYGWPTIGYGEEYSGERIHERTGAPGLEQPVYYWDPVISPGALAIYSGKLFTEWRDHFLVAGLSSKTLIRLVLDGGRVVGEERLLTERKARIREVVEAPDGAVFLLTDDGEILKLTPQRP